MTLFLTYELTFCDSFLDTWQVGFYCLLSLLIFCISDSFIKCLIFPYEVPHCTRSFGPIYFSYISIKYIWSYSFLSPNFSQIFPHPFLLIFIFLSINKTKQNKAKTTHTHTHSKQTNKQIMEPLILSLNFFCRTVSSLPWEYELAYIPWYKSQLMRNKGNRSWFCWISGSKLYFHTTLAKSVVDNRTEPLPPFPLHSLLPFLLLSESPCKLCVANVHLSLCFLRASWLRTCSSLYLFFCLGCLKNISLQLSKII